MYLVIAQRKNKMLYMETSGHSNNNLHLNITTFYFTKQKFKNIFLFVILANY